MTRTAAHLQRRAGHVHWIGVAPLARKTIEPVATFAALIVSGLSRNAEEAEALPLVFTGTTNVKGCGPPEKGSL